VVCLFGVVNGVDPSNRVLDGVSDPSQGRGVFENFVPTRVRTDSS